MNSKVIAEIESQTADPIRLRSGQALRLRLAGKPAKLRSG